MRFKPFAFTFLLKLSVKQCVTIEGTVDMAQATKETAGAFEGGSAARSTSSFEPAGQKIHEGTAFENNDRTIMVSDLRNPITAAFPPHHGGPPGKPGEPSLLEELANAPPNSHSSAEAWMKDQTRFRLPRYPPEGDWRIKTWWIEKWRPISAHLRSGFSYFFSALFWPFSFLKRQELKYRPIPLHGLPHQPTPVWEKLPLGVKGKATEGSWSSWAKTRMGIKPQNEAPLDEGIVKTPKNTIPPASKWRIPEFPPLSSQDPELIKQFYLLGRVYKELKNSPELTGKIDKIMEGVKDAITTETISEENLNKLKELLSSEAHLKLVEALYDKRNELMILHKGMQGVLNKVVSDLEGEANTRYAFRQIIRYNKKHIATQSKNPNENIKVKKAEFLRMKYPKAYEMHLAPLILLDGVLQGGEEAEPEIRAATGYIGSELILERLIEPMKKVTEYAQLVRQVDQIQDKIMEVRNFASSFTKADFADWPNRQQRFSKIVSLADVY